ncbi:hypothetical protein WA158_002237 [Blastocystis sp. Blastoise]
MDLLSTLTLANPSQKNKIIIEEKLSIIRCNYVNIKEYLNILLQHISNNHFTNMLSDINIFVDKSIQLYESTLDLQLYTSPLYCMSNNNSLSLSSILILFIITFSLTFLFIKYVLTQFITF